MREVSRVLTTRELEVVRMVAGGLRSASIARKLHVTEGTVKTRLFHARAKLKNCLKLLLQREGGGSLAGAAS